MPDGAAECLAVLMKEARSKSEYQRIQCVWLRAALHWSAAEIALVVGWRAESVRRVQARYLRQGEAALRDKPPGGSPSRKPYWRRRTGSAGPLCRMGPAWRDRLGRSGAPSFGSQTGAPRASFGGLPCPAPPRLAQSDASTQAPQGRCRSTRAVQKKLPVLVEEVVKQQEARGGTGAPVRPLAFPK